MDQSWWRLRPFFLKVVRLVQVWLRSLLRPTAVIPGCLTALFRLIGLQRLPLRMGLLYLQEDPHFMAGGCFSRPILEMSGRTQLCKASTSGNYGVYLASSSDGKRLLAAASPDVLSSTNSGITWVTNNVVPEFDSWASVASSADGTKLAALGLPGLWTSTNSGGTWTSNTPPTQATEISGVACSADGAKLFALGKSFWASTDMGKTWTSNSLPVQASYNPSPLVCSADGTRIAAAPKNRQRLPKLCWVDLYFDGFGTDLVVQRRAGPGMDIIRNVGGRLQIGCDSLRRWDLDVSNHACSSFGHHAGQPQYFLFPGFYLLQISICRKVGI